MTEEPIISTKERVGEYDAIATAKPDEPLFPLQGGDPFAIACIMLWADQARRAGLAERNATVAHKLLTKASQAEFVAWAFSDYQAGRGAEAAAEQKRYESEDVTDRNVILARAADRLHNALADAVMVAEKLEGLDEAILTVLSARIRDAADTLKDVAMTIEPRRHMRVA